MKMSQRIHFWYQILLKMLIFWENGKKSLFAQFFCDKLKEYTFDLKMLKLLENHVKTQETFFIFKSLNYAIFLKILTKK